MDRLRTTIKNHRSSRKKTLQTGIDRLLREANYPNRIIISREEWWFMVSTWIIIGTRMEGIKRFT
jgi:hypothetical protein